MFVHGRGHRKTTQHGFTSGTEADIWHIFPQIIQDVFAGNCVAVVFVVSIILSLVLPKDKDIKKIK